MGNSGRMMMVERRTGSAALCRVLVYLSLLFVLPAAHAFKLTPITKEFAPSGRGASQAFQLENNSEQTVAVQVSILSREMGLDGQEKNIPADDDFVVFPSQVLLKPGRIQTVRVQWVGDNRPKKELSYRILAEQLPVNLSKEAVSGAKINLIVRYLGSIYIVPSGAKPDVVLDSIASKSGEEGERFLELVFHNQGTAHVILRDLKLTIRAGGKTIELGPDELKGIAGENLLADTKRRFTLPWPKNLPEEPVEISFDFHRRL